MKKILFNLQLFAEEAAAETETGSGTENTTEQTTEQSTEQKQDSKADEPKVFSHSEVNDLIDKKFAEWQKKKDKEIDEAKKLAEMNAEEKANFERDKAIKERDEIIKERDELKKAASLSEMSKTARKLLADEGINISDELLSVIVTPEAEATQANIKNFVTLFKAEVAKGVKAQATGTTPKIIQNNSEGLSEIDKRIAKYN